MMKDERDSTSGETVAAKRPYEKPDFRYEVVFETLALSCGKISPVQAQCRFNPKNS
jgi:hypothetical protein